MQQSKVLASQQPYLGKRILLVLPEAFGFAGGIQMFCRALCLAAGRWAQRNSASLRAIVLNDKVSPDDRYVNGDFDYYSHEHGNKAAFVKRYLYEVLTHHPDLIIIGHVSLSPLSLFSIAINPGVKSCVITYGEEVWRTFTFAERKSLQKAERILAISDHTKGELIQRNGIREEKIELFPCSLDPFWSIDAQAPELEPVSVPPMILTVCRLGKTDKYKGVDSVIRSMPAVVQEFGAVDYRVVGKGDDIPRLKVLAESCGVSRYVTFSGPLPDEELREHYRRCSLFVMPSEREGFGIVFLEAMAYGKPVIGGAHGGTPSVIKHGETGLLVKRQDINKISEAILQILQNKETQINLGCAGRQRLLDHFTFERFEANLDELLRSCLKAGRCVQ